MVRRWFFIGSITVVIAIALLTFWNPKVLWSLLFFGPLIGLGIYDSLLQKNHSIRRNFPIIGHGRYLLESIRPEIQQYFIELDTEGKPMSRQERSVVYQRAKNQLDTVPFGTQHNVYKPGFEWVSHSLYAQTAPPVPHVLVGGPDCKQPYDLSLLNISAMSFGALSPTAILALNKGAKMGGFAHNTGEGGISPYHDEPGGDLIWQIGTAYFGCRTRDGQFCPEMFKENASRPNVKMIEVKLSQGAKPGHGGILPGAKVNAQIAKIRGVEIGKDVVSPPTHPAFKDPIGFCNFVAQLRELSGGKPVGFKLCIGNPAEFASLCKAMLSTGIVPDFVTVDGKEGGTGAAPLEFSNSVGMPLREGLRYVHNTLVAAGLRDKIVVVAAGKIVTGFDIFRAMALGADACNSGRSFMLALGCIQALRCNSNVCPTGVATQDKKLWVGLDVTDKSHRTFRYHKATVHSFLELAGCAGLEDPRKVPAHVVMRRIDETTIKSYAEIYPAAKTDSLLTGDAPAWLQTHWDAATDQRF